MAKSAVKSATVRGTAEGQSPEKGKAKSSGLGPSSEGPSRPENWWLSNEVIIWVKTGETLDGTQVKGEESNSWKTLKSLLDLRRQLLYSKEMF